jgi:fido (protein-threonine AMPylation protein)
MPDDPYADPVTGVLRNKLGLRTPAELEAAEREITHAALIFLKESPVPPRYDLGHLCALHLRIFGDIYDWAGQLRTVAIAKGSWFCLPQYIECASSRRKSGVTPARCSSLPAGIAFPWVSTDELGLQLVPNAAW